MAAREDEGERTCTRLIFAINGHAGETSERRLPGVSGNIRVPPSLSASPHRSPFLVPVGFSSCSLPLASLGLLSGDDVNARRRNDESRGPRTRIACGSLTLCYLANRMKKRAHQAPHQGNEGTPQDRSPSSASPPPPLSSGLSASSSSSSSSSFIGNSTFVAFIRVPRGRRTSSKGRKRPRAVVMRRNKYRYFTNCPRLIAPPIGRFNELDNYAIAG